MAAIHANPPDEPTATGPVVDGTEASIARERPVTNQPRAAAHAMVVPRKAPQAESRELRSLAHGLAVEATDMERRVKELRRAAQDLQSLLAATNAATHAIEAQLGKQMKAETRHDAMLRAIAVAQATERGRISRELHDGVGQQVATLLLSLQQLQKQLSHQPEATAVLQTLHAQAEQIARQVHDAAWELRPIALDDLGLVRGLASFLEHWQSRTSVSVQFDYAGLGEERMPSPVETTLYWVICEAFHNTVKHAQATHVSVLLQRSNRRVIAIVEDNGVGFDPAVLRGAAHCGHLGLIGMRERLVLVDGELNIESAAGRGTTVIARVPLASSGSKAAR